MKSLISVNNQVPLSKIVAFVFEEFDVVVENRGNVDRDYWFIWRAPAGLRKPEGCTRNAPERL